MIALSKWKIWNNLLINKKKIKKKNHDYYFLQEKINNKQKIQFI